MAVITASVLAGAAIGGSIGGSLAAGGTIAALGGMAAGATAGAVAGGYLGAEYIDPFVDNIFDGPDIPDAPTPDAPTVAGDEGIRRGEMQRMSKKRELGALYLTRGQDRQPTLGGMRQSLA